MVTPVKIGVIGCGEISGIYLHNLCHRFGVAQVVGCSDIIPERAAAASAAFGICAMTNEEIFCDPDIQVVVNLTYPTSHYEVTRGALLAGKHVYTEKMLAVTLEEGETLQALAREKGLWLTAAPDTFLGGGLQTARYIVDGGLIGEPLMVSAICQRDYQLDRPDDVIRMVHEPGGGLPFDMGGYYLHAMVNMLGPVQKATGFADIHQENRRFLHPKSPLYGKPYKEPSINTMAASLLFESGVVGSLVMSSESTADTLQKIEIVGTEGSLGIHDPNDFYGPLVLTRPGSAPAVFPYTHPFHDDNWRGLGVADLCYAIKNGRRPRAEGSLGLHAFEVIHRVWQSTVTGQTYTIENRVARPEAMPRSGFRGEVAEFVLDHG